MNTLIAIAMTLTAIFTPSAPAPYIVGEDWVAARNPNAVLIYTASKQYRNDRLLLSQFEVAK